MIEWSEIARGILAGLMVFPVVGITAGILKVIIEDWQWMLGMAIIIALIIVAAS